MNLRPFNGVPSGEQPGPAARPLSDRSNAPNMTHSRIVSCRSLKAALAVAALLCLPGAAQAAVAPSPRGPSPRAPSARTAPAPSPAATIARVGSRVIDETDIRTAAEVMTGDPLRRRNPALWRRKLVDRLVDRELLAAEAERRGYLTDESIKQRIRDREYGLFLGELYRQVLIPGIEPTKPQMDSLQASGLYRGVDLDYILFPAVRVADATGAVQKLRQGARFDSTAQIWSLHPSKANGGHLGWVIARDLDPRSYAALRLGRPGDVLGPYAGPYGVEIYRLRDFRDLPQDSLYRLVKDERQRGLLRNYQESLLAKYHFAVDTTQVNTMLLITATEPVGTILATLGPDGTRAASADRHALGVIARVDGDSITFRDLALSDRPAWGEGEKIRFRDQRQLADRCGTLLIPGLVRRDARDRGIDKDPAVERALRLIREEEATRAMAAQESGGPPDSAAVRAYYEENAARYKRPEAVRARVVCFHPDSSAAADAALRTWLAAGPADAALASHGFKTQARATATTIWPGRYGDITVLLSDPDPVAAALRGLPPGKLSPAVRSVQGIVVAEALEHEGPRPLTFEEAAPQARIDAAGARESRWVSGILPRLRSDANIQIATDRLAKLTLSPPGSRKGTH